MNKLLSSQGHSPFTDLETKEKKLKEILKKLRRVLIAYSGGVDSTYLLAVSKEILGANALAVFARGAMISPEEEKEALAIAEALGIRPIIIDMNIFTLNEFVQNPPERCYYCKKAIFQKFLQTARLHSCDVVLDGTNFSDEGDYRPGRKALEELGIISPLKDVQLTKDDIRQLSYKRGLSTWNKPSMACLASRIPYGEKITPELLKRIAQAESVLARKGFGERRVRIHGDIARIEIPVNRFYEFLDKKGEIIDQFLELGFRYVTLDLMGIRSGSLNPVES